MASEAKAMIDILIEAAAPAATKLVADAIDKQAKQAKKDKDILKQLTLEMASDVVAKSGVEALDAFGTQIADMLDGKKVKIEGVNAKRLTELADAMQEAEAKQLAKTNRWARNVGKSAKRFAQLLPQVLRGFIL